MHELGSERSRQSSSADQSLAAAQVATGSTLGSQRSVHRGRDNVGEELRYVLRDPRKALADTKVGVDLSAEAFQQFSLVADRLVELLPGATLGLKKLHLRLEHRALCLNDVVLSFKLLLLSGLVVLRQFQNRRASLLDGGSLL